MSSPEPPPSTLIPGGPGEGAPDAPLESLLAEQARRWRRGDRADVEAYLDRQLELRDDAEAVLHLIFNEVVLREQDGETPSLEEYQRRFPHLAEQLSLQFAWDRLVQGELLDQATLVAPHLTPSESSSSPPELPTVPGYEILAELGRGGMGVVYQAWQTGLNRMVALKMVLAGAHAGPEELARFRSEAEAVARLQHPNIVQIYDIGEHEGRPFFSLEFVDGGTLARRLDGTPLPPGEAAGLAEGLARAAHYAHERGVVHRDLKPANVLLASGGRASGGRKPPGDNAPSSASLPGGLRPPLAELTLKIADFGLAKLRGGADSGRTRTGAVMGTPSYMAPEQARGKAREIGPAADVYALGAILYELLVGRPPFKGASVMDTLAQVASDEPVPPRRLQPKVPRDLETICLKCLQKEPARRYASAAALADDLRRFLEHRPIQARPAGVWERGIKWARRRPAWAALIGLSAAAAVALAVFGFAWNEARVAAITQNLREQQRVQEVRTEAATLLADGRLRLERDEPEDAQGRFEKAVTLLAREEALADLRAEAEELQAEAGRRLAGKAARDQDHRKLAQLRRHRDDAYFLSSQVNGRSRATNVTSLRSVARTALALFADHPLRQEHFQPEEWQEILNIRYALLLLLADAETFQIPGEDGHTQAEKAMSLLEQAKELRKLTRSYHLRRAACLAALGKEAKANDERNQAGKQEPADALDCFLAGAERFDRQDVRQAAVYFTRALDAEPGHFWARFRLAVCCLKLQRFPEAESYLRGCLSQQPHHPWSHLLLGFAFTEQGAALGKEGQAYFAAAEKAFRQAEKALAATPEEDGRYVLLVDRAALRLRQGKVDQAETDLLAAVALRDRQFQAYTGLAQVQELRGRLDEAVKHMDRAIELQPDLAALYRTRSRLHARRRDLPAALGDLDRAVEKELAGGNPSRPLLAEDHRQRGFLLTRQGKYEAALKAYETASAMWPELAVVHRLRGDVLVFLDRWDDAARAYDEYLKRAAVSLADYLRHKEPVAAVYRARGTARARLGNAQGALDDFSRALELEPEAETYALRGWLYLEALHTPEPALHDFEEALKRSSGQNTDALCGRAYARVLRGEWRRAVAEAAEAVKQKPREPRVLWQAARVHAQAVARLDAEAVRRGRPALEERRDQQDQALKLLRAAREATRPEQRRNFWEKQVRNDRALDPIRNSPGFRELEQEFGGVR